jgi:hypothetical protein
MRWCTGSTAYLRRRSPSSRGASGDLLRHRVSGGVRGAASSSGRSGDSAARRIRAGRSNGGIEEGGASELRYQLLWELLRSVL